MQILERRVADVTLWEFIIVLILVHMVIGVILNMFSGKH